jgi:hypothetical protein
MAGKKDAKIEIGVDGADSASAAFSKIFGDADKASARFFNSFSSVSESAFKIVDTGIKSMVAGFDKVFSVDVGKATEGLINFSRETSRMAEFFGRSSGSIKAESMALGRALGMSDEKAGSLLLNFSRMANSTADASKTLEALGGEALLTGRSVEEMAQMGAELHNRLGVPIEALPELFAQTRSAAEAMGTVGGPRALQEQLMAVSGAAANLAGGAKNLAPVLAAMTKGLTPEQQKQAAGRLTSFIATNTEPLRRQLGYKTNDFYDASGAVKVDPMELALRLQRDAIKRYGGREAARRVMMQDNNLGAIAGSALFNVTPADVAKAKEARPSRSAQQAMTDVQEGSAESLQRHRDRKEGLRREIIGRMGMMIEEGSPEYESFVKQHPLVRSGLASENVMKAAIEGGKSFTNSTLGMDRLLGWMGAGDVTDIANRQQALEDARRAQGKQTIAGVEAVARGADGAPVAPGEAGQPGERAKDDTAQIVGAIKDLKNALGARPPLQVDVVNATGAPDGAIQAYQSGQTRQ